MGSEMCIRDSNLGEPAEAFEWYRVGMAVGNVRNQGAELINPLQ